MANVDYQKATSPLGGSYTENKLTRLKLPALKDKTILDLGCNAGAYCRLAIDRGAAKVVGIDIDRDVIARAKAQVPEAEFFDSGWDNGLPNGPFDVVFLFSAIHYASDPVGLVDRIHNALNDDGLLILEGGLFDQQGIWRTDCLIPAWRAVGDRCRHLSYGYIKNHLLSGFSWSIVGESEPRGGDNVDRVVIHANKIGGWVRGSAKIHRLDLLEYCTGLCQSLGTIAKSHDSTAYMRSEGMSPALGEPFLDYVFGQPALAAFFLRDLLFALHPSRMYDFELAGNVNENILKVVVDFLNSNHLNARILSR